MKNYEYIKHLIKYPISRTSRHWIRSYHLNKSLEIKLVMTLLVKNEEDIIERNIRFHKAMGVDGFIVTNHNSTDRTAEILEKLKQEGLVLEIINETLPVYKQSDFVDKMIKIAKNKYKADWIINADADEFYYSACLNLKKSIQECVKAGINVIIIESKILFPNNQQNYLEDSCYFYKTPPQNLYVSIDGYSYVCPKVIFNTKDYKKIFMGNHYVDMKNKKMIWYAGIQLYHYHIRNYEQWKCKVERYLNTYMPEGYGIHMQEMIKHYKSGDLIKIYNENYSEYVRNNFIKTGKVYIDKTISNYIMENNL